MTDSRARSPIAAMVAVCVVIAATLVVGIDVVDQAPAGAATGQLPTSFTLTGLAGRGYKVGSGSTNHPGGALQQVLHPGAPNQCADSLNNEANLTYTTAPPDTNADYGDDPQCTGYDDHDESVSTISTENGEFPSSMKQDRELWQVSGTRSGDTITVNAPAQAGGGSNSANAPGVDLSIPVEWATDEYEPISGTVASIDSKSYLLPVEGPCTGVGSGAEWTGSSTIDGAVTLTGCALYETNIQVTGCTGAGCGVSYPASGEGIVCRTSAFPMTLTTGTSTGVTTTPTSLTGTPYDTTDETLKMVSADFVTGTSVTTVYGSSGVCADWGSTSSGIGLSSAAINRFEVQFAVDDTASVPACLVSGEPQPADCWAPRALGLGDQTTDEGQVVTIPAFAGFDQAGRSPLMPSFGQTWGPFPAVIKTVGGASSRTFVAPSGGNPSSMMTFGASEIVAFGTSPYGCTGFADFGPTGCVDFPYWQTQVGTTQFDVTVYNVAPTANAGLDQRAVPGSITLKGSSSDPTDPESSRSYAWSWDSGPANVTPDSPSSKTTTVTLSVPGTYDYALDVDDGDGGIDTDMASITVVDAPVANTLSGHVTDSATGAIISGATVRVFGGSPIGPLAGTDTTDSNGDWSWTCSSSCGGNYYVQYSDSGMVSTWYRGGLTASFALPVTLPNALVDGQVGVSRTISGNVTAAVGGAAVSGETVRLYDENGWLATTTTASGGAYSFTNLPAKSTYRVQMAKGSASYDQAWYGSAAIGGPTLDGGKATKIDVTSADFTAADVTLYTPSQSGLTGTVDGCFSPTECEGVQVRFYQTIANGGAWVGSATTDASGNFDMSNLRPGTYRIWFWTKSSPSVPANTYYQPSEWYNNLAGEQYQNTGSIADTYTVGVGPGSSIGTYTFLPSGGGGG